MPKWEDVQKRANKLISEGMKLLKSGMSEAEYIAEAAAESTRLHVVVRRSRFDRYKALHDLGQKAYDASVKAAPARQIELTDSMTKLISRVKALEAESRAAQEKIGGLSITKKEAPKPPKRSISKK